MPKSRRTRTLSLDAVVEEAVRLVRTQGVPGLTMRSVASELGVTPMAIYYYVADKDELLRLVVAHVSDSFGLLRREPGRPWQDTLRVYLMSIWQNLRRYPGLSSYLIEQPGLGVTPDRLQSGVAFFEDAGFAPAQARLAWSFATTYIHGRISVDTHLGRDSEPAHAKGLKARDYVAFGVEAVIEGLEAMLERGRGARGSPLSDAVSSGPHHEVASARYDRRAGTPGDVTAGTGESEVGLSVALGEKG